MIFLFQVNMNGLESEGVVVVVGGDEGGGRKYACSVRSGRMYPDCPVWVVVILVPEALRLHLDPLPTTNRSL